MTKTSKNERRALRLTGLVLLMMAGLGTMTPAHADDPTLDPEFFSERGSSTTKARDSGRLSDLFGASKTTIDGQDHGVTRQAPGPINEPAWKDKYNDEDAVRQATDVK